jgi:hypothetical protein
LGAKITNIKVMIKRYIRKRLEGSINDRIRVNMMNVDARFMEHKDL